MCLKMTCSVGLCTCRRVRQYLHCYFKMLEIQRKVEKKWKRKNSVVLYFDGRSTLAFVLWAANTGSLKVSAKQLFSGLFVAYDENVATIYDLRFPRIFIAMAGGAATAVSGVLLQAVMKNPLADPGIIGVSSGASLTAVLLTAFCPSLYFSHRRRHF